MKIITEIELRDRYKKEPFTTYTLAYSDKLTPAASQFLSERRITVVHANCTIPQDKALLQDKALKEPDEGYLSLADGAVLKEKPEYLTHLRGKTLIPKNHPRIIFRGKVDSVEAQLTDIIVEIGQLEMEELKNDLGRILEYLRKLLRAEVTDEALPFIEFNGWSEADIREYSQKPQNYFGVKHFFPGPELGKIMAKLNLVRTALRELELAAVDAFYDSKTGRIEREDIILALNRLSSLVYVIMCRRMKEQSASERG